MQTLAPSAHPAVTTTAGAWNLPLAPNPHFTGREHVLAYLERFFAAPAAARPRVLAVYAPAGTGKTELAAQFAHLHRKRYAFVWWLGADEPTTLALTYARLAPHLGLDLPRTASLEEVRHHVKLALAAREDYLLIFDNAPAVADIRDFVPAASGGHILITSRGGDWDSLAHALPLRPMERAESVEFLSRRTGRRETPEEASRLAQALGDLPLALEQAAACIGQTRVSFTEYLARFESHWADLLRHGRPHAEYPVSVSMTWELSIRQVEQASPASADLLNLCAFFSPDGIPRSLLMEAATHVGGGSLANVLSDAYTFRAAIAPLAEYSLVDATDQTVSVHRLVAALARDRLNPHDQTRWASAALAVTGSLFRFDSARPATWDACADLLPHVLVACAHAQALLLAPASLSKLLNDVGRYMTRRGQFPQARSVLKRALLLTEQAYGPGDPRLSPIANNLGRVLGHLGEREEARGCFERAMALDQAAYGPSHPHVAEVANNYAICLQGDGRLDAARQYFEWALRVYETHYGAEHPKVASIVNNLGVMLRSQGDLAGAKAYFDRALSIAQHRHGPQHPHVASILSNIGVLLHRMGDLDAALAHHTRALDIDQAALGNAHPDVARDLVRRGRVYKDKPNLAAAIQDHERALLIVQDALGTDHARLARLLYDLSHLWSKMGNTSRAEEYQRRAARIWNTPQPDPAKPADDPA